jgi:hypothetical protein
LDGIIQSISGAYEGKRFKGYMVILLFHPRSKAGNGKLLAARSRRQTTVQNASCRALKSQDSFEIINPSKEGINKLF